MVFHYPTRVLSHFLKDQAEDLIDVLVKSLHSLNFSFGFPVNLRAVRWEGGSEVKGNITPYSVDVLSILKYHCHIVIRWEGSLVSTVSIIKLILLVL